jgi:glycosyltransferase involved in cell wall biosynthesis
MSLASGLTDPVRSARLDSTTLTVVTQTPVGDFDDAALPFRVVRQPGFGTLVKLIWRADVIHLAGPVFLPMLFGFLFRKPVVVEHSLYQAVCPNGLLLDERTKTTCPGHFMAGRYSECLRCNAASVGWQKSLSLLLLTFPRRLLCQKVARNIGPTEHVTRRVALPRTVTIQHGVPELPSAQTRDDSSAPVTFAYVGRLVSKKGLDLLIEAAHRLVLDTRAFKLKFIGDGPERAALEAAVDSLALRQVVTFTGFLRAQELESAMSDVAALVMPSVWEETAGLAAMEHMMRGRVVIASDIGGLAEVVADAGLLFPLADILGLVSCMKRVIDQPGLARLLGEKARARATRIFLDRRMVDEHAAVFGELLSDGSVSTPSQNATAA